MARLESDIARLESERREMAAQVEHARECIERDAGELTLEREKVIEAWGKEMLEERARREREVEEECERVERRRRALSTQVEKMLWLEESKV